ncbi:MAG: glucose-1-phosphate adenylyltransferase [Dehalococcoidia bacterium]|nr:glucose-1-phosphate adenylyltransferase [Dehalococcoidia bacterium]
MSKVATMILAGGQGERLSILAAARAKPAVPFGGGYRIIDFTLSNCVNSGIYTIAVLTQYHPRSLNDHIGIGRSWDLDRRDGGVFLLQPYVGRGESDWYRGTADAVYQNLYFLEDHKADHLLILAGDHVYKMNYENMLDFHRASGADVTVGVVEVPWEEAHRYGLVVTDDKDQIVEFQEKPAQPETNLASMGIYIFDKDILFQKLHEDAARKTSTHDFGKDILPRMIGASRVMAYPFRGYWRDVGTIPAYWQANMDLLDDLPEINLYDTDNLVYTNNRELPAAKIGPRAHVSRSLVSQGCIVNGYVEHSILSPGVFVEAGAVIKDSIIFNDTFVSSDSVINFSILDKQIMVKRGCHIGYGDDFSPNFRRPDVLSNGITLIGKNAQLPSGLNVGRNCIIGPGILEQDFNGFFVPSGETMDPREKGLRML